MGLGTAMAIGSGLNFLGAGLMGGQEQGPSGNLHLVNPMQQALYNRMGSQLLSGGGDFGFGTAFKQGKSQLQDLMAQRGISPDSGVYGQQMGNMTAGAVNQDAQNRRNTWFQLMGQPLQTAQVAGANYVPGSPSAGANVDSQSYNYGNRQRKYGGYASPWV